VRKKKAVQFKTKAGLILVLVIFAGSYLILFKSLEQKKADSEQDVEIKKRLHKYILSGKETKPGQKSSKSDGSSKKKFLAIVIDDIGYDRSALNDLLQIDAPITISILPHCRYSIESAEKSHQAGREILLHLPMEPLGYPEKNPGEGALLTEMDNERLRMELAGDLESVPYLIGVNNHMGSKLMENGPKLRKIFNLLKEKELFFLDSRTTANSKAKEAADATGIGFVSRDVFIDNGQNAEETYNNMRKALREHTDWNKKVLIGHPYPSTTSALKRIVKELPSEGIEIVPISKILESTESP
jgi:hypothetical protein